jgi:hypothetical protein
MPEQIILQQALFGYRDGHNLLAASTALAPRVRNFLATITDSSGPENNKGFEGAFTGLPVPETDYYALFRTWPAPEMPRPGCVWSHVILIQLADLARMPELFHLGKLCSRPSVLINSSRYADPLAIDVLKSEEAPASKPDQRRLRYLVRALYEHPDAGVVILDEESASWESAVFQIWAQQWPRLRREFAFSTGSLGDRRLADISFDLQIAPVSSERLWRRVGVPTLLLNFRSPPYEPFDESVPLWVDFVEKDLLNESDRRFRKFLFNFGSDVEKPRAAFGKLATVYKKVGTMSDSIWVDLLCSVGEFFPVPTDAVQLKRWLVREPTSLSPSAKLEHLWSTVSFLLNSSQSAAYSSLVIDFANLAISLWKEKREQTISMLSRLVQQDEKPAAISFAEGFASAIDSISLRAIAEEHGELIPLVIRHNPALAFEIDTWKLSSHLQTQVYEALTKISLSQAEWGRIVGAMFIAATYVSMREAIGLAGPFAMPGAFRWLDHQVAQKFLPTHSWRDALASPAVEMLSQTIDLQPAQLALCAWCASPIDVRRILSASRADIQRMAEVSPSAIPHPLRESTTFLLLTLGLRENSDSALIMVLNNFFIVHDALASGNHSSESWWLLSPELPMLGIWRDWDRCERLRRAVHSYLVQHDACNRLREFAKTPEEKKIARKVIKNESDESTP